MSPIDRAEGCRGRTINNIYNHGEWEEYPLKINASSVAIPSRLLATSSIFSRTLSISDNRMLGYHAGG